MYSLDLDLILKHYVEEQPVLITITNHMACVAYHTSGTCTLITRFHKLSSFELVIEHDVADIPVFTHKKIFYLYDETRFTVFEKSGQIIKKTERDFGENEFRGMNFFNA